MIISPVKKTYIINEETGAVHSVKEESITSRLWNDKISGGIINCRNHHKKFYSNRKLSELELSDADLLKTFKLSEYIVKNTNIIGRRKGSSFGSVRDISLLLGISEKKTREYLSRAIKKNIIAKITVNLSTCSKECYAFNPIFINSCKYVPPVIYKAFQSQMEDILPDWMKDKYSIALKELKE